jgi:protein-disulfide isomerase
MSNRKQLAQRRRQQAVRNRLIAITAIVVIAAVLVGFVILQNSRQTPASTTEIVPGDPSPVAYANGKALGADTAPIVIQEFGDFQCPICQRFHDTVQGQIVEAYVATVQARFEFHHYIVIDGNVGGNESRRAAEASECANEQGLFWNYHSMLYANQHEEGSGAFADSRLTSFAENLGLDMTKFNACFSSGRYSQNVRADEQLGVSLGVHGTPSVFVNGQPVPNPLSFDSVAPVVEAELAKLP